MPSPRRSPDPYTLEQRLAYLERIVALHIGCLKWLWGVLSAVAIAMLVRVLTS
jgi:hypothetical protein